MSRLLIMRVLPILILLSPTTGLFAQPEPTALRVMSYNIHHGTNSSGTETLAEQARVIKDSNADLVGLQEVDDRCARSGNVNQPESLAALTGMHQAFAPHYEYQGGQYGNAILSRFPLSDVRNDRISLITEKGTTETRNLLSVTITLDDGTTMVFASVHMGLTTETRALQAREIIDQLRDKGVPTVLTGDFNAEPQTPELIALQSYFSDTRTSTTGTYPVGTPIKIIDYIMVSQQHLQSVVKYDVLTNASYSDHYPVVADIGLRR